MLNELTELLSRLVELLEGLSKGSLVDALIGRPVAYLRVRIDGTRSSTLSPRGLDSGNRLLEVWP